MELSKKAIDEFKELIKKDYPDEYFTENEILEMANNVMGVVDCLYQPIPAEDVDFFWNIVEEEKKSQKIRDETNKVEKVHNSKIVTSQEVAKALKQLMLKDEDLLYKYLPETTARRLVQDFSTSEI
jgi:hypothetical protein